MQTVQIIVMGVSGAGKSTLGMALADRLSLPFIEGDDLHAPESIEKMRSGIALDDSDRWPWLDRIGSKMAGTKYGSVASCSCLKKAYRDRLRQQVGAGLRFVFPDVPEQVLRERLKSRAPHFFAPSLISDQLRSFERPRDEPDVLNVYSDTDLEAIVRHIADPVPTAAQLTTPVR